MTNVERIALFVMMFAGGVALGMAYEHRRFLKEIQGVAKQHADDKPPQEPLTPAPQPDEAA